MPRFSKHQIDRFCRAFLESGDPEQAARLAGVKEPYALLQNEPCRAHLRETRQALDEQLTRPDVLRHMARLAFGRANDCVKLALDPAAPVEKLDLRLLSELKRTEKGAVEIKLIDRVALLQFLFQNAEAGAGSFDDFFRAMAEPAGPSER